MPHSNVSGPSCHSSRVVVLAITALIATFAEPLYPQSQSAESQGSRTISGTVLNSVTHEPIGRAMVYTADSQSATFTDDRGHFELEIAAQPQPAGGGMWFGDQGVVRVKKPGFLSDKGPQGRAFIGPKKTDVTLSLVPEALIVGQVKFPSSETADQAQVVLYRREVQDGFGRWERLSQVRTRSSGEYRFAELRPGKYKVFTLEAVDRDPLTSGPGAPVYGFPPRFFAAAHDFTTADTIEVRAGETVTANLTPERQRYYEVKIPVMKPEPADWGVMVTVHAQGHRGPGFALGYDPNQKAIRGTLPNGTFTIEAATTGPSAYSGITSITIANGPVFGPPLAMTQNPSIEINVRAQIATPDGSRTPPPTAFVTLQSAEEFSDSRNPGSEFHSQATSLPGVKPGRYWVQVQPSASNLYAASVRSGLTDLLRAPLVVAAGASMPPIEITLRDDMGEIEARVEGAPDEITAANSGSISYSGPTPPGGISVYAVALGDGGGPVHWFNQRRNGLYIITQLPPGDYRVMAFDSPQEIESHNPIAMRAYESKGKVVHVTAGKAAQVAIPMSSSE